jgi:hypothetical protein
LTSGLSWSGINNYLGANGTIGSLSLFETPERLLNFIEIFSVSLGLALIPLILSFKGIFKQSKAILLAILTILFVVFLYVTDNDPITWHFLPIAYPLIMVLIALGLYKMRQYHQKVIAVGACVLILVNGIFLNANVLANQYPVAQDYSQELRDLPDGSYVVGSAGGYGLENYYVMATGKDIRPLFFNGDIPNIYDFSTDWQNNYRTYLVSFLENDRHMKSSQALTQVTDMLKLNSDSMTSPRYQGYLEWMQNTYGLQGGDTVQQVKWLLSQGVNVYLLEPTVTPYWQNIFKTEGVNIQSVLDDGSKDIVWSSLDNNFTDISKIIAINVAFVSG